MFNEYLLTGWMNEYKTYANKEVEGEVMVGTGEREADI